MRDIGFAAAVVVGTAMAFAITTFAIALPAAGPPVKTDRFEVVGEGLCAVEDWDDAADACLVWRRGQAGHAADRYVTTARPGPGRNTTILIRTKVSGADRRPGP